MLRPAPLVMLIALATFLGLPRGMQPAAAQAPDAARHGASGWRAPDGSADAGGRYGGEAQMLPAAAAPITPTPMTSGGPAEPLPTRAQVSKGPASLPNEHGQVWREYDISPYTIRVDSLEHPEQSIVDWILRETGYEAWHSTPVGLLSADRKTLRVYHTPQMQALVAEIVDRFVSTKAQNHGFGLRVITMKNPNWRTRALPLMTSIPV